jgi:hypothetical protein
MKKEIIKLISSIYIVANTIIEPLKSNNMVKINQRYDLKSK